MYIYTHVHPDSYLGNIGSTDHTLTHTEIPHLQGAETADDNQRSEGMGPMQVESKPLTWNEQPMTVDLMRYNTAYPTINHLPSWHLLVDAHLANWKKSPTEMNGFPGFPYKIFVTLHRALPLATSGTLLLDPADPPVLPAALHLWECPRSLERLVPPL